MANWAEESNGRGEAGTYELAEPVEAEVLPGLLAALGLESLGGVGPPNTPAESEQPPDARQAWRQRRANTWFQLSRPDALNHYAALRKLLLQQGDLLVKKIDTGALLDQVGGRLIILSHSPPWTTDCMPTRQLAC
ncbi:DUF6183 family protein [Streptomyces cellostaticus]|uniref:DUF6183 family protein n=1 Tax=Streptomyces cellostaticus TaxID=67285 RepID=UPI002026655B|nr:DUF6183 family protein [Streptomyces cellostaticus]